MLLTAILIALFVAGLLIWHKKYYLNRHSFPQPEDKVSPYGHFILVAMMTLMTFCLVFFLEYTLTTPQTFPSEPALPLNESLVTKVENHEPAEEAQENTSSLEVDILPANKIKTKLADIAGMNAAKKEVKEFISFIKDPEKYHKLGANPPKGIMIYGPPGTGKTLLARAIAGESNMTFISVSGSAFEEVYVGKGAARVRQLFEIARKYKPCIVFIDEIDTLAPSRKTEELSSSQIQTINQLLAEMQNINEQKNTGIFILAATNRLEALDAALLRPGRFDWQLQINLPTDQDRQEILQSLLAKVIASKNIDIKQLVERTAGFSGAELNNLINEAAIYAVRNNQNAVDMGSLELSFKKLATNVREPNPSLNITILSSNQIKTRFSDVAGMNEAKSEVTEVIDFLKDPKAFTRLGAKPPNGIMIYGPPGTGKTLMARAIAGEANATFIAVSGADFEEQYVGVGAARVRELFKIARKYKPCIVFIDEIDALAPQRTGKDNSGHDQTVNQLLSEMDNIQNTINEGIIFIGATNRLDIIDKALLRPGRFDRKVFFRLPSILERQSILQKYIDKIHVAKDVDVQKLAQITAGFSGADLANLVNEAAIDATRRNKSTIDMASFEEANDKISLGIKLDNASYTAQEKKLTAYHEAGHALVGLLHPDHPRLFYKMTIGLRNSSLGVTHFRYEAEKYSMTKKEFESVIATALGGYVAEEIIFGKDNITSGAASDLVNANEVAKDMVAKYGMSDNQSLLVLEIFPSIEGNVAEEAEKIIDRDYDVAKNIIQKNIDKLHTLANALLENETLDYDQIAKLLNLKAKNE